MIEQDLKELIISRFGNLKKFCEKIEIPWSTLDGVLKRGVNKANITTLIKICEGLNIDCESLYYGKIIAKQVITKYDMQLNEKEKEHISKYRQLKDDGKEMVDMVLNREYQFLEYRRKMEEIRKD